MLGQIRSVVLALNPVHHHPSHTPRYVDNPFPIQLLKMPNNKAVECVAMSYNRSKVAVIDEDHRVIVYELRSQAGEGSGTAATVSTLKAPARAAEPVEAPTLIGRAGRRGQKGAKKELAAAVHKHPPPVSVRSFTLKSHLNP